MYTVYKAEPIYNTSYPQLWVIHRGVLAYIYMLHIIWV